MTACPIEAISISSPGAKEIKDDLCVGCKLCTIACPYGTIFFDPETHKAFKCDLCGGNPACQTVCPTGAIEYVEIDKNLDWIGSFANERSRGPSGPLSLEVG